jgi:hypothetical protein
MASVMDRRKRARSKHPAGSVSRFAQQRVNERVRDVMARRDAAQRRESHSAWIHRRGEGVPSGPGRRMTS